MAAELEARCGVRWVDAPVSGGTPGAESGSLAIMAGGRAADIERLRPVLSRLGQRLTRMGEVGAGQATWQALQPMHLDTSISFATSSWFRTEGIGVVVAERAWMS